MYVLTRDAWVCAACGKMIDSTLRPPHPLSASVHHMYGKARGDDPTYLRAMHRQCNNKLGDPNATTNEVKPTPLTKW